MVNLVGPVGGSGVRPSPASTDIGAAKDGTAQGATSFEAVRRQTLDRQSSAMSAVGGAGADDLPPPSAGDSARLRWAAEQLEALLMHELLKSMRNTVPKTGMFDSPATNMFEEMLDEERANEMARSGGMGLAELIYEQMSRHLPMEDRDED